MKNRISLQQVVAMGNTPKAKAMVIRYGYEPATSVRDLVHKLNLITSEYREEAFQDLADIHPHKDLIANFITPEITSGSDGCKGDCGCKSKGKKYSNFEMADEYIDFLGKKSQANQNPMQQLNQYLPMIAIAGILSLAIVAIKK